MEIADWWRSHMLGILSCTRFWRFHSLQLVMVNGHDGNQVPIGSSCSSTPTQPCYYWFRINRPYLREHQLISWGVLASGSSLSPSHRHQHQWSHPPLGPPQSADAELCFQAPEATIIGKSDWKIRPGLMNILQNPRKSWGNPGKLMEIYHHGFALQKWIHCDVECAEGPSWSHHRYAWKQL